MIEWEKLLFATRPAIWWLSKIWPEKFVLLVEAVRLLGLLFQNDRFCKSSRVLKLSERPKKMLLSDEKSILSGRWRELQWVVVSDSNGVKKRKKYVKIRKKSRKFSFDRIIFLFYFYAFPGFILLFFIYFREKISTHSDWAKVAAVAADQSGFFEV